MDQNIFFSIFYKTQLYSLQLGSLDTTKLFSKILGSQNVRDIQYNLSNS